MTYRVIIHNLTNQIHNEEFDNIVDLFRASDSLVNKLVDSSTHLYGGVDNQLLFKQDPDDLFKHAFTRNFKNIPSQDIYKLKNHWLEIAYNLHNNTTKSFLSNFEHEYKLPCDLQEIKFTDGVWISVVGQNISKEDGDLDFICIINSEGLKVICANKEGKIKILNYKLEEIEYYIFIDFKNNCEFKYTKD